MKFHTKYSPPKVQGLIVESESLVQEQFADQCNTDSILRKYEALGFNPFAPSTPAQYLDCTQVVDLRSSLQMKRNVDEYFEALPAKVRFEFGNDSLVFSEAVLSGDHDDRLRELGILPPKDLLQGETLINEGKPLEDSTPVNPQGEKSSDGSGTVDSVGL